MFGLHVRRNFIRFIRDVGEVWGRGLRGVGMGVGVWCLCNARPKRSDPQKQARPPPAPEQCHFF